MYPPTIQTHGDGTLEERRVPKWGSSHHLQLLLELHLLLGCECLELVLSSEGRDKREGGGMKRRGEGGGEGGREGKREGERERGREGGREGGGEERGREGRRDGKRRGGGGGQEGMREGGWRKEGGREGGRRKEGGREGGGKRDGGREGGREGGGTKGRKQREDGRQREKSKNEAHVSVDFNVPVHVHVSLFPDMLHCHVIGCGLVREMTTHVASCDHKNTYTLYRVSTRHTCEENKTSPRQCQ